MPILVPSLTDDDVRAMLALRPRTLTGTRDRALIAMAYDASLYMREAVALNVEDLELTQGSVRVSCARARRDDCVLLPTGEPGRCPVLLLKAWLDESGLESGPLIVPVVGRHARRGVRLHPDLAQAALRRAAGDAGLVIVANEVRLPQNGTTSRSVGALVDGQSGTLSLSAPTDRDATPV